MKKIKILAAGVLALSSITLLAGCGNNSNGKELALTDSLAGEVANEEVVEETYTYPIGEVIPTPEGEVYYTTINGVTLKTNERRFINANGIIKGMDAERFHDEYKIYDTGVVKIADKYIQNSGSTTYRYCQFKGLKKGTTKVTANYIETSTGKLKFDVDYYLEVDSNLNVCVFFPGNGMEK